MDMRRFFEELERICTIIMPASVDSPIVLVLLLQAVFLLLGLIRLFLPDYREHGLITIGSSLLYALGIYLIDNNYMPIIGMIIFAAVAIYLGILNLTKGYDHDKGEVSVLLVVYGVLVAIVIAVIFFLSKQSIGEFLGGITRLQWQYAVLLACFGVRFLHWGEFILYFFASAATSGPPSSNYDGVNGATGTEQNVDTTSMSD